MKVWLIDAGPLVTYLNASEPEHQSVADCIDGFGGRLCTTSAVITEAMHLLQRNPDGPSALAVFADAVSLEIYDVAQAASLAAAADLMRHYHDTPMDFADATLVLLADRIDVHDVLTLDRRGFLVYRAARKKRFRLVLDHGRGLMVKS